jgi:hypothetical protein
MNEREEGRQTEAPSLHGLPDRFVFGDGIDWSSPLAETRLFVELPFWLMTPPGPVGVEWSGTHFTVDICSPRMEVFFGEVTDSGATCFFEGPWRDGYVPSEQLVAVLGDTPWLQRPCRTVLRLTSRAHSDAFREPDEAEPPRVWAEHQAYWASLCEAHLPVVNELIQRYRLLTYDYFPYELSAWDVPVWHLVHDDALFHAVLLAYKEWDRRPVVQVSQTEFQPMEWVTLNQLTAMTSDEATPGEFDLLRRTIAHGTG